VPVARRAWDFWVDTGLPLAGRAISPGWHEVGRFLGDSIRNFHSEWPLERLLGAFRDAGFESAAARGLSLGGCLVLWGRRR
jgi:demethylmenaquinone methyltransferase/2-methoxy-6-polyprenyl-1,4-benzoquinol methylase